MLTLKFQNGEIKHATIITISEHIIAIHYGEDDADRIENISGFQIYRDLEFKEPADNGEYLKFTTLYRSGLGLWYELSNNGSTYEKNDSTEPDWLSSQQSLFDQIRGLEDELTNSDYKIVKAYEYSLVGKQIEYDMNLLHAERQEKRNSINMLQDQLTKLHS